MGGVGWFVGCLSNAWEVSILVGEERSVLYINKYVGVGVKKKIKMFLGKNEIYMKL